MKRKDAIKFFTAILLGFFLLPGANADAKQHAHEHGDKKLSRPNILMILADDLGYSDISPFGGEIRTPNLDRLADSGITMTNFYANQSCSPTRAALMSGTDTHIAGLGVMFEMRFGLASPAQMNANGYQGYLLPGLETLPRKLQEAGYHTYMAGKWHLANLQGGLGTTIPAARGFERSFALMQGGASHFGDGLGALPSMIPVGMPGHNQRALYVEDLVINTTLPTDFYSTTHYTDKLIEYIESNRGDGRPFFAYAAYTAPHWPLQLPNEALEEGNIWQKKFRMYEKSYQAGYEVIGKRRLARMARLGIIKRGTEPNPWDEFGGGEGIPAWNSLSNQERKTKAREMAIYSVMVEYMDYQIGRLLKHVDQDTTMVVFMSDNGAEATVPTEYWGLTPDPNSVTEYENLLKTVAGTDDYNGYENLGRPGSYLAYDAGWTRVSALPHRGYKMMTTEGGIRVPLIARIPGMKKRGTVSDAFGHVMDLMPTFLHAAQAEHPNHDLRGSSMIPLLTGKQSTIHGDDYGIGWEMLGGKAYIEDGYKLFMQAPTLGGLGTWELYDLIDDQGENYNLIDDPDYADRADYLLERYNQYADETGVVPFP
ncbi:MAG: sulfatase-like hydrolase/transferase [Desulfobacteraceae bacterium]|nr:sulfatase-like hydrolase/transferase [Desulfobacteraceae bacterium]